MAEGDTQAKFAELRTAIKNEDYEQALALSSAMAETFPDDIDVIKCKCVSLIHLGKFEEVLKEKSDIKECNFERAYCLYQLSRLPEALKIIRKTINESNSGGSSAAEDDTLANMKCLEAQVLYKLSSFTEAANVYQFLIDKDYKELEGSELLSNALAAYSNSYKGHGVEGINKLKSCGVLSELIDENDQDYDDPDKSCELAYSTACAYINSGQYEESVKMLELAERRYKEHAKSLMEEEKDATSSSGGKPLISEEEAAISSQMGYALLKTSPPGSAGAAKAMLYCMKVLKATEQTLSKSSNIKASVAKAVCVNNLAVIRRDKELSDSLKRLKNATTGIESKLTPEQLFTSKFNYCLILLHMNKTEECRSELEALQSQFPNNSKISVLQTCLELQINKHGQFTGTPEEIEGVCKSLDNIAEQAKSREGGQEAATEALLAKVQLQLQSSDYKSAADSLSQCSNIIHHSATIATLVDLYERFLSNPTRANEILDEALSYYTKSEGGSDFLTNKINVMLAIAGRKLLSGNFDEASELYQQLVDSQDLDSETRLKVLSHLILAKSWKQPEEAEALALQLPDMNTEADEDEVVDAEQLEAQCNLPRSNRVRRLVVVDRAAARAERKELEGDNVSAASKKRNEKKRKEYLAKLTAQGKYDPLRPTNPDPERWIAKKLRSYNRRRGKNRNQGKYSGAQGTSSEASQKDAAKLDAYARAQAKKENEAKAAEEPTDGKRMPYRRLK